jgi:hypothetical protein
LGVHKHDANIGGKIKTALDNATIQNGHTLPLGCSNVTIPHTSKVGHHRGFTAAPHMDGAAFFMSLYKLCSRRTWRHMPSFSFLDLLGSGTTRTLNHTHWLLNVWTQKPRWPLAMKFPPPVRSKRKKKTPVAKGISVWKENLGEGEEERTQPGDVCTRHKQKKTIFFLVSFPFSPYIGCIWVFSTTHFPRKSHNRGTFLILLFVS